MIVFVRDYDELGRVISPTNYEERDKLRKDFLKHATQSNGVIDWDVFQLALLGHRILSDLLSDSSYIRL